MPEYRSLTTHDEFAEAVALQRTIWGFDDVDLLPKRLFVVASKIGGQVMGAFDGGRMVAFLIAIPGIKPGPASYLHSHMLGVLPEYRNAGVGRQLKLMQREEALVRGVHLIEWTFDPLELKNAFFNIERLGAVVKRFVLNQYGISTSSLHAGLPTDRCIAEWWIDSARVHAIASGETWSRPPVEAKLSIPSDIEAIKASNPKQAREIQERAAEQFLGHFSNGLYVSGFERTPDQGIYLLSQQT